MIIDYFDIIPKKETYFFDSTYKVHYRDTDFKKWLNKQFVPVVIIIHIFLLIAYILQTVCNTPIWFFNHIFGRWKEI